MLMVAILKDYSTDELDQPPLSLSRFLLPPLPLFFHSLHTLLTVELTTPVDPC